ncbi:MAG: SlyX family protein [Deltaproteobacteria bacterium]|nr:SlyX family protein [Deltaproteobacteria bacterium]
MSALPAPSALRALRQEVERLQVRSAFQERVTQELSDQVYALHGLVAHLRAELEALRRAGEGGGAGREGLSAPHDPALDRPPHY